MFIRGKTLFCNIENKKDKTKSTSMIETVFNSLAEYLTWERQPDPYSLIFLVTENCSGG